MEKEERLIFYNLTYNSIFGLNRIKFKEEHG